MCVPVRGVTRPPLTNFRIVVPHNPKIKLWCPRLLCNKMWETLSCKKLKKIKIDLEARYIFWTSDFHNLIFTTPGRNVHLPKTWYQATLLSFNIRSFFHQCIIWIIWRHKIFSLVSSFRQMDISTRSCENEVVKIASSENISSL